TPSTDEQPARPSNAFMLYRTDQHRIMKQNADAPGRESDISKQIGKKWKAEPEEVKKLYKARAAATAAEHKRRYPNYKFTPNRR
ncbi:high mobility group box domain-containing protein, partial [Lenzites betulinus]